MQTPDTPEMPSVMAKSGYSKTRRAHNRPDRRLTSIGASQRARENAALIKRLTGFAVGQFAAPGSDATAVVEHRTAEHVWELALPDQ
jgi:hypothetical protein